MVSENADEWAEVKNGSNSDCILESLTALKNQLLDGPHSRQISLWRWCLGISGFKNTDSNVKSKFRTKDLVKCTYPSESQERGGDWDVEESPLTF